MAIRIYVVLKLLQNGKQERGKGKYFEMGILDLNVRDLKMLNWVDTSQI